MNGRGETARSALLAKESIIRHVSMYEFFSKHFFKRCKLMNHEKLVALQVMPGFSADCGLLTMICIRLLHGETCSRSGV